MFSTMVHANIVGYMPNSIWMTEGRTTILYGLSFLHSMLLLDHFGFVRSTVWWDPALENKRNSFRLNPRVCVEVAFKKTLPPCILVINVDCVQQQKVSYLKFSNACFSYQTHDHLICDCPHWKPSLGDSQSAWDDGAAVLAYLGNDASLVSSAQVTKEGASQVLARVCSSFNIEMW